MNLRMPEKSFLVLHPFDSHLKTVYIHKTFEVEFNFADNLSEWNVLIGFNVPLIIRMP